MTPMTFRSRTDSWLLIVMLGTAAVGAVGAVDVFLASTSNLPISVILIAGVVVLPVWILANTRYVLTDVELRIHSGPFRWYVPVASIRAVTPTRNPLASPALSLDRLRIEYDGRAVLISPDDPETFLQALYERRRSATAAPVR